MYLLEKGAICFQVFLPPKTPEESTYSFIALAALLLPVHVQ